jgi:hypothetical protein
MAEVGFSVESDEVVRLTFIDESVVPPLSQLGSWLSGPTIYGFLPVTTVT